MGDLDPCKLYIKGVWSPLNTADVLECLSEYGQVTSVSHAADKGFAHVTFASSAEATRALAVTRIKNIGVICEISRRSRPPQASFSRSPAQFDLFAPPSSSRGRPPSPRRRGRSPSPRRGHSYSYTSRAYRPSERDRGGRGYESRSYRRSRSRSRERRGSEREDERRSSRRHRSRSRSRQRSRRSRSRSPDRCGRRRGQHSRDRHRSERRRAGSAARSSRHDRRRSSTPLRAVSVIETDTSPRSPAPHVGDTRRPTPSSEPQQALTPTSKPSPPPAASASPRPPAPSHHPSNRPENADSPHPTLNQHRHGSEGSVVAAEEKHSVAATGIAICEDEEGVASTDQGARQQHQRQAVDAEATTEHVGVNGVGSFDKERCRLAVRNLSSACSAESLRALASECGRVTNVVVHRYYVGEGLLEFGSQEEAEKALRTVNGRLLHGLTVRLQKY